MKKRCVILGVVLALCAFGADKGEKNANSAFVKR